MTPTTDGLAGCTTTPTGARQAQDPAALPVAAGPVSACPRSATGTPSPVPDSRSRAGEGTKTSRPAGSPTPLPGGTSAGLSGAEWRAAAKRAQSGRQPRRAAPRAAAKVTIPPLPATGARLTASATCMGRCDWTAGPGDPAEVDTAAAEHTKAGLGHPTNTVSEVTT